MDIYLAGTAALLVTILQWPIAIVCALLAFITTHNIILSISLVVFPIISWVLPILEIPINLMFPLESLGGLQMKFLAAYEIHRMNKSWPQGRKTIRTASEAVTGYDKVAPTLFMKTMGLSYDDAVRMMSELELLGILSSMNESKIADVIDD